MDMKRFKEISWQEAIAKWLDGEHVFSSTGRTYCMKGFTLHYFLGGEDNGSPSSIMFNDVIEEHWYIKKPFDVRAEMLARPDEWVGAFKDVNDTWHKVGFDTEFMKAIETPFASVVNVKFNQAAVGSSDYDELEKCIPIEDVPQEEWT
ncbi:hypothetical protein ADM98_11630 [Exiguobacterium sp. BMC-KP]|uniref:hypothetical protein n=1 Tax=Exiguobacterium sp. BMC-KP TaxID=1684312 RepID=UPI0006AA33A0|nr:hypothetical protein [Exiguobacterium sp. BMC-KP]KOP29511.1 hypothetical protein ADM98_11630 [Exiguobacterium sp. BMC-KP]